MAAAAGRVAGRLVGRRQVAAVASDRRLALDIGGPGQHQDQPDAAGEDDSEHPDLRCHAGRPRAVLELAAALGKLPERIVIFAVEIGARALVGAEMCDEVAAAAMELIERVREEVSAARNSSTPAVR